MNVERVEVSRDAFLRTTGQLWKVIVAALILPWPAVAIGLWEFRQLGTDQSDMEAVVAIGAMCAIAASIMLLLFSVRCPQCHTRLLLKVMRAPEGLDALTAFLNSHQCIECGFNPR